MATATHIAPLDGLCHLRRGHLSSNKLDYKSKAKCKGLHVKISGFFGNKWQIILYPVNTLLYSEARS